MAEDYLNAGQVAARVARAEHRLLQEVVNDMKPESPMAETSTTDVGELVRRLAGWAKALGTPHGDIVAEAADALTALEARVKELESGDEHIAQLVRDKVALDAENKRLRDGIMRSSCPDTLPCERLTAMAKAHADAEAELAEALEVVEPFATQAISYIQRQDTQDREVHVRLRWLLAANAFLVKHKETGRG